MKLFKQARKYGAQIVGGTTALLASTMALAQSDPFATATASITEKVETYGAALVGVAAVGVIFMVAMKYVKKLPRAA